MKIAGLVMLAIPFACIFIFITLETNLKVAVSIYGATAFVVLWVMAGFYLMQGGAV